MAYIGNQADTAFTSLIKQDLTGASGDSLTLTHAVANANDIALYINNVRQEPISAYSTNGTAVSLTGSVVSSDDIYVIYLARAVQTTVPPDGSVSTAKLADNISVSSNFGIAGKTNAPTSPTLGDMWFNSSTSVVSGIAPNAMAVYNGSSWNQMSNKFSGTGGAETTYTSGGTTYKVHTFLSTSTFTVNSLGSFDSLIIAGGGGGGASGGSGWQGGGGGAGGYITTSGLSLSLALGSNTVTVGTGGASANNGLNSVLGNQTAIGGGRGGQGDYPGAGQAGASGGSGGGGGQGYNGGGGAGGAGTSGQGFAGGAGNGSGYIIGGGGGSSGSPPSGANQNDGGAGTSNSIRAGTPVTYASGGGHDTGAGGDNTGNGGQNLTAGGSGIVIIRYAI